MPRRSSQSTTSAVDAVLDVLLVAGHLGGHARRAAVEALERRPVHALDARELEHDVVLAVERGQLALGQRPDDLVGAGRVEPGAVGRDDGQRRAARCISRDRGDRLVDALEPDVSALPSTRMRSGPSTRGSTASTRREDVLVDPVAHEQARGASGRRSASVSAIQRASVMKATGRSRTAARRARSGSSGGRSGPRATARTTRSARRAQLERARTRSPTRSRRRRRSACAARVGQRGDVQVARGRRSPSAGPPARARARA